jgi:hypothetical protein
MLKPRRRTEMPINRIEALLFENFGPVIGGQDLYQALGFKSYSTFYRIQQRQGFDLPLFQLPGRRGWFALTSEVAKWLVERSDKAAPIAPLSLKETRK